MAKTAKSKSKAPKPAPVVAELAFTPRRVLGFDPGRDYYAWAVVEPRVANARPLIADWRVVRTGFMYAPPAGVDSWYGFRLSSWAQHVGLLVAKEFKATVVGAERYTHRRFGGGTMIEDFNVHLGALASHTPLLLFRNTEWKRWLASQTGGLEAPQVFMTSSPHEADAAGIAMYAACMALPKRALRTPDGTKIRKAKSR